MESSGLKKKILIVDDEAHIAEILRFNLNIKGFEVIIADNGKIGLELWKKHNPDLVVIDLMMPEIDGIGVIGEIRKVDLDIPLLVLSAKDQVKEKVKCLNLGVDDYLSKPFHLDEFLARVDRLLTRSDRSKNLQANPQVEDSNKDLYQFSDVTIDFNLFRGSKGQETIDLTSQELKLLRVFFNHPNVVLTREEILKEAWGYGEGVHSRTLDNFIVRFRRYFEDDPKNPKYFKSVRSVGYVFDISH